MKPLRDFMIWHPLKLIRLSQSLLLPLRDVAIRVGAVPERVDAPCAAAAPQGAAGLVREMLRQALGDAPSEPRRLQQALAHLLPREE